MNCDACRTRLSVTSADDLDTLHVTARMVTPEEVAHHVEVTTGAGAMPFEIICIVMIIYSNGFPLWCDVLIRFCCTMVLLMMTGQSRVHYQTSSVIFVPLVAFPG